LADCLKIAEEQDKTHPVKSIKSKGKSKK